MRAPALRRAGAFAGAWLVAGTVFGLGAGPGWAQQDFQRLSLSYLESAGARGEPVTNLIWGLLLLSIAVVVAVGVLVVTGIASRGTRERAEFSDGLPVVRTGGGLGWIYAGLIATTIALAAYTVWTVNILAAIADPAEEPLVTIEVVGHQWWWEVRYTGGDPEQVFETANEIHIPAGEPVRLRLRSADVIHSFWVPALSGKTDLIPGQVNETWIEADEAGVYRGQCAEYCGEQHAHMALRVFADPPEAFAEWRRGQLALAQPPETETAQAGQRQFNLHCGACHRIRGTVAGGELGPDLTHLMSRTTIAANTLPNTPGHLSGWIANPQTIKPGSKMPRLDISGPQLDAIRAYLTALN